MQFTNTLTGKKEPFEPLKPGQVSLYVCGVTVYDDCHIGHARGAVVFDVLRRYLEHRAFRVTHVRNVTDVDDKIIERARGEFGLPGDLKARVEALARRYTESFEADFSRMGLLKPHHEPRATAYIPQMIRFIETLLKRGAAYVGSDGVYFSVRQLPGYGALSHQKPDRMLEGQRGEGVEGKRDPLDFVLWKKAKPDEPAWESPWGPGRPGWHIECSTMSTDRFKDGFDIHGGGQDLIFPHHENERAQALGAGQPFARYWLHNGLLTVGGQKMSKSLGNVVTIGEVIRRHSPDVLRLFYLATHYRSPLDFTWERLDEAAHAYDRLTGFLLHAERSGLAEAVVHQDVEEMGKDFHAAMEDDLNTPEALAALFKMAKAAEREPTPGRRKGAAQRVRELGKALGFFQVREAIGDYVEHLRLQRDKARQRKDYAEADAIRRRLLEEGYLVEDTVCGTVVRKKS